MPEPVMYLVNELLSAVFRRCSFSEEINALVGKTELGKTTCSPASVCVCVLGAVPGISFLRVGGERGGVWGAGSPRFLFFFRAESQGCYAAPPKALIYARIDTYICFRLWCFFFGVGFRVMCLVCGVGWWGRR